MSFLKRSFILGIVYTTAVLHLNAADTATASVTFAIGTINAISISGNPATLVVNAATAGSQPVAVTDKTTTYNLTSNATNQRITGAIDTAMPSNVTLDITLTAPSGATSAGPVTMTTTGANLVTGISNVAQSNIAITYTLSATVAAKMAGPLTRTVTYTLGP